MTSDPANERTKAGIFNAGVRRAKRSSKNPSVQQAMASNASVLKLSIMMHPLFV